jgi:tRNA 2-thiouridine synthesizing protein A
MSDTGDSGRLIVDTRGMFCPIPIIKISEAIQNVEKGSVVELISDDPAIALDLPAWCTSTGHTIVHESKQGSVHSYRVKKG